MLKGARFSVAGLLLWPMLVLCPGFASAASPEGAALPEVAAQKTVLVTGASTGIGRSVTEHLAADGYFVYAGARKDSDLAALNAIRNVQALRLDVTSAADIAAAVQTIGRGLYALVNNAGVATVGSFAEMKDEELDLVMAVNLYLSLIHI